MRIDLHVHSKFSDKPSQWVLKKLGSPESFVEPMTVYRQARAKGMDMVTISDHNTIQGALEIAHLPGTFVSEEITTFFPEDHCKVHVLAWDIDEAVHEDIQHVRENIYDLVAYLRHAGVKHGVAHPLYGVNDKLTVDHFEKLLLLFRAFECNGARNGMQNDCLRAILAGLTPEAVALLADRHGIDPYYDKPHRKTLTGGSDDHSGLNIARMYTEVPDAAGLEDYFGGLFAGRSLPGGTDATPKTMAHNLSGIVFQFFKNRYGLAADVHKDPFFGFLDGCLCPESEAPTGWEGLVTKAKRSIQVRRRASIRKKVPLEAATQYEVLRRKGEEVFLEGFTHMQPCDGLEGEEPWFDFFCKASDSILDHYANDLMGQVENANIFSAFSSLASTGALYTLVSPFLVAYTLFMKDRDICREAMDRFAPNRPAPTPRLAHFTDTFFDTNGVAITLQQHVEMAQEQGKEYTVITCAGKDVPRDPGVEVFEPIGAYSLPEYSDLQLFYPPLLRMMAYVYEGEFTHIHTATPGPIGLAALGIAKALNLPISGTYHTAFPEYVMRLTGDEGLEDLMWKFMTWYYGQMDVVYVPSEAFADELAAHGIARDKIRLYPRGVNVERFTPALRNGFFKRYNLNGNLKCIYVGRISKEKNLPMFAQVIKELDGEFRAQGRKLDFVMVGDGPYRQEMEAELAGTSCLFTGELFGNDLAAAFASSDLFVFPSTTDTFGNVVLEAQASGLPVVVTDQGGPRENCIPERTGVVSSGEDPAAFAHAIRVLLNDPERLRAMGREARVYTEARCLKKAFQETWDMYVHGESGSRARQ